MSIAMYQSWIRQAHTKRTYTLLDVATTQYHGADDLRWVSGVDLFTFATEVWTGDLTACDIPASGQADFNQVVGGADAVRLPFTSMVFASCRTTSGRATLDEMKAWLAKEHDAVLPNHVDQELVAGGISGLAAQSLDALGSDLSDTTAALTLSRAEAATVTNQFATESIIVVPLSRFSEVVEGKVRDVDGKLRTQAGNIVVPHVATSHQTQVFVLPAPLKVHLGPKNLQVPKSWINVEDNIEYATSEVLGLIEVDANIVKFDIT